jgi:7,8-dihydropterin-6-yl-methyl-4-(beta-D-ribofuranosyl)aminobenzene 5'-phosphate synthase
MKITIIYDNEVDKDKANLKADWGFACLIEVYDRKILFDTGANGDILFHNMEKLNINPTLIEEIFISHNHWDHTGGLSDFLKINPVKVYIPISASEPHQAKEVVKVKKAFKIHENIFSTGELGNTEQSLIVKTGKGVIVIVGCSHPGIKSILDSAVQWGKPYALIGGMHGFKEFNLVEGLELICPTHCTQYQSEIKSLYPQKYVSGGAGKVIEI